MKREPHQIASDATRKLRELKHAIVNGMPFNIVVGLSRELVELSDEIDRSNNS